MPLCISTIKAMTASVPVEFAGDVLHITYRPGEYTPDLEDRIEAAAQEGSQHAAVLMLLTLLASWDLRTEPDGPEAPLDEPTLRGLPSALLLAIMRGINKDSSPNETSEPGSFTS